MAGSKAAVVEVPEVVERALGGEGFTVENFVESFPVLVDAAGGTKQLRQLVLMLATRGRLTQPQQSDGSVERLLSEVQSRRAHLVRDKKASRADDQGLLPPDQIPYPIPESWRWVRFGIATVCRDGQRIPVSKEERAPRQGNYPYYGASGVIDTIDDFIFDEPLLLLGEDGANLVNRSTPIAFIATGKYWVNNHAHVLDGANLDYLRYLALFINATDLVPYVTGTAQPKMNQAKMNSIPVALPPLAEQKRIVARVDQLMALIDQLEAKQNRKRDLGARFTKASLEALGAATEPSTLVPALQRVLANWESILAPSASVPDLRQACLDLCYRGRLTGSAGRLYSERFAADGDVGELQISNGRDATSAVLPGRVALAVGPAPVTLPQDWRWVPIMAVARLESGHTPSRSHPDYWNGGIPWIGIPDARDHHRREIRTTHQNVSRTGLAHSAARLLPAGTVCLSRTASIGYVTIMGREMATSQDFVNWVCSPSLVPQFLMWLLVCEKPSLLRFSEGAVHRTIYYPEVKAFHIALPPLSEQRRIVAKVEHLMKLCDALEAALRRREDRAAKLAEAVVQEMVV